MKKGNKAFAKVLAMVLAVTSLLGATGCGGGSTDSSTTTVIKVANFGGGVGRKWLDEACARFKTLVADKEYSTGKKGVEFDITHNTSVKIDGIKSDATHIYFLQDKYANYYTEIQKDSVLDITDIVKEETLSEYGEEVTIESKIDEEFRFAMKGNDGKYYMLPHYETLNGPSYDVDLFVEQGLYLADQGGATGGATGFDCALLGDDTYYFVNDEYTTKSVGNDGIAGTYDDGLPTTLNELVAQCAYIKSKGIYPFGVSGAHIDYSAHLIEGLWTGLAGYEQRQAVVSHKVTDGVMEYVTGESSEELWTGTGIKKPTTELVTGLTSETAYKAIDQASRYYAFAFMELANDQGWFYDKYKDSGYTHKDAMKYFLLNGTGSGESKIPLIASHIEGSYWYNEAKYIHELMADYKLYTGKEVKNIAHWHMPTSYGDEVVTSEENAREEANTNSFTSMALINGNLDDRPGKEGTIRACKDFLKFLSTEQELRNFTACTGVSKALYKYTIDDSVLSNLDLYQKTVMDLRANNRIVNQYGDNATYRAQANVLAYSVSSVGYRPDITGNSPVASVLTAIFEKGQTAWQCFKLTGYDADTWRNQYYVAG